jgi:hypothetical protein
MHAPIGQVFHTHPRGTEDPAALSNVAVGYEIGVSNHGPTLLPIVDAELPTGT